MMRLLLFILLLIVTNSIGQTNTFPPEGNTGIGTTTPTGKLYIIGADQTADFTNSAIKIEQKYVDLASDNLLGASILFRTNNGVDTWNTGAISGTIGNPFNIAGYPGGMAIYTKVNDGNINGAMVERMKIDLNGNIGIGFSSPAFRLDVNGGMRSNEESRFSNAGYIDPANGQSYAIKIGSGGIAVNGNSLFNNYVGIGTSNPQEALSVNGNIRSKEVKVEVTNWPDYVFQSRYKLAGLPEVEKYISENGHLPNFPSAEEANKTGISVGEMNTKLLEKIEELTLYMIELKKENTKLQERVKKIEIKNKLI